MLDLCEATRVLLLQGSFEAADLAFQLFALVQAVILLLLEDPCVACGMEI